MSNTLSKTRVNVGGIALGQGGILANGVTVTTAQVANLGLSSGAVIRKVALAAVDTAGGVFAFQMPQAGFIDMVILDVTTVATGACTLDIGYTTVSAATLSDTIIDGVDVHSATGTFDNVLNAGTNGVIGGAANTLAQELKVASGKWITGSTASGASAGLVGNVYIRYVLV